MIYDCENNISVLSEKGKMFSNDLKISMTQEEKDMCDERARSGRMGRS